MAMLALYPEGRRTLDVPRELLFREAQPGDVSDVSFAHNQQATERMAAWNRQLTDELLERNE